MSPEAGTIEGVVCRFSNSGNAILQVEGGEELNLGPLPEIAEGERVRVYRVNEIWGVCVDLPYATEEYLEEIRSRVDIPRQVDLQSLIAGSSSPDVDLGEVVTTTYTSDGQYSEYKEGNLISVSLPDVLEGLTFEKSLPVKIVSIRRGIAIGVPALDTLTCDEVSSGDLVKVDVKSIVNDDEGFVGITRENGLPVVSPDVVAFKDASIKLGVTEVFGTHVHASPSALPDDKLPSVGEVLFVDVIRSLPDGTARGLSEEIPTVTDDALGCLSVAGPFKMGVDGYTEHGVSVSVQAVPETERPGTGDVVECSVITPYKDGTLCRVDDLPVWIADSVPKPISSLRLSIVDINPSHLRGSAAETSSIRDLSRGDSLSVEVEFADGDDGVGKWCGVPVVVPGGQDLRGNTAEFGVEEVRDGSVIVGVDSLDDLPVKNDVVTLFERDREGGRVCIVDKTPLILPPGSDWPAGDVRLGVSKVTPVGVHVSVADLPSKYRPDKGAEIELHPSDVNPQTGMSLVSGVPVQISKYDWSFCGPLRLGVDKVQPNCVSCSVRSLPSIPDPGDLRTVDIDEVLPDGCGGRIDGVPTFLPRTDAPSGETSALLVDVTEEYLVAVEADSAARNIDIESDTLVSYYRELLKAKQCWEDDAFRDAREHCRTARQQVTGDGDAASLLRLDAKRHETILAGEHARQKHGCENARETVETMIKSFVQSNDSPSDLLVSELQAYRFVLDASQSSDSQSDGTINRGYLNAVVRKMTDARDANENPWGSLIPHPVISTLLASLRLPSVPAAEEIDEIVSHSPEYWPFLTLSELR